MKPISKLKKIPVVIRLYPEQYHKADLLAEAKINKYDLNKELIRQPAKYAFWASLYSKASEKVAYLEEKLERLESRLFILYSHGKKQRVSDVRHLVTCNKRHQKLKTRVRLWKDAERHLKYAERTMQQRLSALQSVNANTRREWKSEGRGEEND